jgi:glycosyltransferase involved in cell wall biosynthesis
LKLSRPDVVIASSTYPADIFPAKFLADKCQAKLVYEVHDLWPLSPIELGGMSRFHPFILLMQFAEDFAYKYANVIVSMLPKTLDHMKSRGLQSKKWFYIPNGICLKDWEKSSEVSEKLLKLISNEKDRGHFLIAYCGAHGLANSLLTLIKAAKLSLDLPVTFFLIGKGPEKEELIKEVENLNLNNVVFIDHVSKSAIPKLLPNFDALYIGLKKQSLFRFGISPNKLIDYMMSGRPVIQAINAGNDMVKEADCGYSIEPENPKEIVNAIKKLLTLSDQERSEMGLKGKQYVIANHDYRKLAVKFAELLLNI